MGHSIQNDHRRECITKHPHELYRKADQVCWGLVKGLAYLHEHRIAHMDIKPDDPLVDQNRCVKIIDFDVALQVKDEEVSGRLGPKHWMAPLTGSINKTSSWA